MPIYEFACKNCRTLFSFFSRRVDTETVPPCPKCGKPLSRQISLFQARSGGAADSDPWGLANDGCDDDTSSAPDFDAGDDRIAGAVEELGSKIDRMDDNDPSGAAQLMKEFSDKAGVKFEKGVRDALDRIASGDNSESAQSQLEEAMSSGNPFAANATPGGSAGKARHPFVKDPTLYEMECP